MSSEQPKKGSGCLKVIFILFTVFVLITIVTYFTVWRTSYDEKDLAKINSQIDEMFIFYRSIPEKDNGWKDYEKALDKICLETPSFKIDFNENNYILRGFPKEKIADVDDILDLNKDVFQLVDKGFEKNYIFTEEIFLYSYPPYGGKHVYKIPALSELLLIKGDREKTRKEALKRYIQAVQLYADTIENLLGFTHINISYIGMTRIKHLLLEKDTDPAVYKYAISELTRLSRQRTGVPDKLKARFKRVQDNDFASLSISTQQANLLVKSLFKREINATSKMFTGLIKAFDISVPEGFKKLNNFKFHPFTFAEQQYGSLIHYDFYDFVELEANAQGLPVIAALQLYKVENGEYPDNLDQLVPKYLEKLPEDPLAPDKMYKYRKKDDGFILYGVGTNGKDDRGKTFDLERKTGDFVILDTANKPDQYFRKEYEQVWKNEKKDIESSRKNKENKKTTKINKLKKFR